MDLHLRGRTAMITGGSRGIGFGAAKSLAAEGCNVTLVSKSPENLARARAALEAEFKVTVKAIASDLGAAGEAARVGALCADVDILVNNAGAIPQGSLTELDVDTWKNAYELKIWGFVGVSQAIYPAMCKRGKGVIVNVMGTGGERPTMRYIAGSLANAGLMAFTRGVGADAPKHGVRVVGINPGATETDRQVVRWKKQAAAKFGDENRWRELVTHFPFGRMATVAEVADVITFVASDRASYISGSIVTVDGGDAV